MKPGHLLWCDGDGFSTKTPAERNRFLGALNRACAQLNWDYLRDAGDGVALTFLDDPRQALEAVRRLDQTLATIQTPIRLRYGLHHGEFDPDHLDALQTQKPLGDAVIIGARTMSIGQGGHVLMTHEYFEALRGVMPVVKQRVMELGEVRVKTQIIRVYNYWDGEIGRPDLPRSVDFR